jgi:hypothetical protein
MKARIIERLILGTSQLIGGKMQQTLVTDNVTMIMWDGGKFVITTKDEEMWIFPSNVAMVFPRRVR